MTALLCLRCGLPCATVGDYADLPFLVQSRAVETGSRLYTYAHAGRRCAPSKDPDASDNARKANRNAIAGLAPWSAQGASSLRWADPSTRYELVVERRHGRVSLWLATREGRLRGERPLHRSTVAPQWFARAVRCAHAHAGVTRAEMAYLVEFYRTHRVGEWLPAEVSAMMAAK